MPTACYAATVSYIEASAVPAGPPERLHGLASWLLNQARVVGDRQVAARFGRSGSPSRPHGARDVGGIRAVEADRTRKPFVRTGETIDDERRTAVR